MSAAGSTQEGERARERERENKRGETAAHKKREAKRGTSTGSLCNASEALAE